MTSEAREGGVALSFDDCKPGMEVWHISGLTVLRSGGRSRRKPHAVKGMGRGIVQSVTDAGVVVHFDDGGAGRPFDATYDRDWFRVVAQWGTRLQATPPPPRQEPQRDA